jgi:hypothetical protein
LSTHNFPFFGKDAISKEAILCQPQRYSSEKLWNCRDTYGNQHTNLIITQRK